MIAAPLAVFLVLTLTLIPANAGNGASMAWLDQAIAAEVTNVSTPSGATHGSLVNGNIPCANGPAGLNDCGKTAPAGQLVGTSDSQTLTNKTISGAQNTLTAIPDSALSANVDLLNGAQTATGLKTFSGGLALPSGSNPAGSNFYIDSNGALHLVNANGDFQLFGAKASGDATRPWLTAPVGSFITESSAGQQPNLTCTRQDWFNSGSGLDFCLNTTLSQGKGITTHPTAYVGAGTTGPFSVTANANIAVGQAVYGPGIPNGDTVAAYSSGSLTLSAATTAPLYANVTTINIINASNSTSATSSVGNQGTCLSYTTQTGVIQTCNGANGYAFKNAPSANIAEGGNILCNDQTGLPSLLSGGACIGAELDDVAEDQDTALSRMVLDLIQSEGGPAANPTTFGYGVRLRPGAAGVQYQDQKPVTVLQGFVVSTMAQIPGVASSGGGWGSYNQAFSSDGGINTCVFCAVSGVLQFPTLTLAASGQNQLTFALGKNINVGQAVSGSANLPTGDTVTASYQCAATNPQPACGGATNETLVILASNLTGNIASATNLTFTGTYFDGSQYNGIFNDGFVNWTNQLAGGLIKAGTLLNSGTVLDIRGFGEDSTNTTGVAYADIDFDVQSNTHGAVAGNINLVPAGIGCVKISGTCTGTAATQSTGTSGATIPLLNGANTWSGVQTYGAGDFVLTGAANGDIGTFNSSHALQDSGTLLASLAPLASPTFTGTLTAAALTAYGNVTTQAHVISNGAALTSSNFAFGAAAGTIPTFTSITGDDRRFNVNFTSGTSPPTGVIATITFANAYGSAPQCILSANGGNAAAKMGAVYLTSTTTTVVLNAGIALGASLNYLFNINCTG